MSGHPCAPSRRGRRPRASLSPARSSALAWALAWTGLAGSPACGHRTSGPAATVEAFGRALERGDTQAAYALTSTDYRRRTSYEAFASALGADATSARAFGTRLATEAAKAAPPRVEVRLDLGEMVPLVIEDGRWVVDGPGFETWGQRTPRAALRTFIRALDARRYDVVLRLVPNRYRGELTAEKLRQYWEVERKDTSAALLTRLRASAAVPLVEADGEAHLPYGGDREVRFVREDGLWKIESPE